MPGGGGRMLKLQVHSVIHLGGERIHVKLSFSFTVYSELTATKAIKNVETLLTIHPTRSQLHTRSTLPRCSRLTQVSRLVMRVSAGHYRFRAETTPRTERWTRSRAAHVITTTPPHAQFCACTCVDRKTLLNPFYLLITFSFATKFEIFWADIRFLM